MQEKPTPSTDARSGIQIVQSDLYPKVSIQVHAGLAYLGHVLLDVNGLARAEQHYFAQIQQGRLGRTFIVHFEHFLPDNEHCFDYPRLRMVHMGGFEFLHQNLALEHFQLFDLPEVQAFLEHLGIQAEPGWLVNRYVTVVDEAKKNELILFYLEPGSTTAVPIADLLQNCKSTSSGVEIEKALTRRANAVFQLLAEKVS